MQKPDLNTFSSTDHKGRDDNVQFSLRQPHKPLKNFLSDLETREATSADDIMYPALCAQWGFPAHIIAVE